MSDIERIVGRVGIGTANPKDLVALKNSINIFLKVMEFIPDQLSFFTNKINTQEIEKVFEDISNSLDDDPSTLLIQGGVIREGYNSEIDELRGLRRDVKQILLDMQKREIERTHITSLKISYNNVFGYYIEVTKTNIDKVPQDYIRKQTLANAERYITDELKQLESRILSAEEKLLQLESQLFLEITARVSESSKSLLSLADVIATIDILNNFGEISRENRYVKPVISNENILRIKDGRHPVIEKLVENFTPNNVSIDSNQYINIITGPNMSGKSTYIRQVAIICLMAQIGCFVPAEEINLNLLDRIFTRVGASDNLSKGESTFMVEMSETANILNNATEKSLVILDEIGRGTSTYDGVAIAWSVVEYMQSRLKSKTLFATHYHELTEMKNQYKGIENYNVRVLEQGEEILFTHKIIEGAADRSYGIYVAKIAGVPDRVISRSNEILKKFESQKELPNDNKLPKSPKKIAPEQLGLI
jgi:DNA mismatch repair protein MutS